MKTLVIYDSFFGNTEQIAQAIARGLGSPDEVELVRVGSLTPKQLTGVQLLVVGSPTRGFQASEATMDLLKGIPAGGLKGVRVAAFDTRMSPDDMKTGAGMIRFMLLIKVGNYAANPIANALKKAGGQLVAPPEGFWVKDSEGPLKEGELERAEAWGRSLNR